MPLPQPLSKWLQVDSLAGIDVSKGELSRPLGTFKTLENFDLVEENTIRKMYGATQIFGTTSNRAILGLIDYKRNAIGTSKVIAVNEDGNLLDITNNTILGNIFTALGDTVPTNLKPPYMVVVSGYDKDELVNYLIITRGPNHRPVKYLEAPSEGNVITSIGAGNPLDEWLANGLAKDEHIIFACAEYVDRLDYGVQLRSGRMYVYTYYNPITKKDSSPTPICEVPKNIVYNPPGNNSVLTTSVSSPSGAFEEIALFFYTNTPAETGEPLPTLHYGSGYTHIRIWASLDGSADFHLLPVIYNGSANDVCDPDYPNEGAIKISDTQMVQHVIAAVESGILLDGFSAQPSPGWVLYQIAHVDDNAIYVTRAKPITGNEAPWTTANVNMGPFHADLVFVGTDTNDDKGFRISSVELIADEPTYVQYKWNLDTDTIAIEQALGTIISYKRISPLTDTVLSTYPQLNVARDNDPPPKSEWGCMYQNILWLIDAENKTRLRYSRAGDFEYFPWGNYIDFTSDATAGITALVSGKQIGLVTEGRDQRLFVGQQRAVYQILGTDPATFEKQLVYATTGIRGCRVATVVGGTLIALTMQGLEIIDQQRPQIISKPVKTLLDTINNSDNLIDQQLIALSDANTLLLMYGSSGGSACDTIMLLDLYRLLKGEAAYSTYVNCVSGIRCLFESMVDGIPIVLAGCGNGNVYQLFTPISNLGISIISLAETNAIPSDDRPYRKVFKRLRLDGNSSIRTLQGVPDSRWTVAFAVDGGSYTPYRQLREETFIGLVGRVLTIKFRHLYGIELINSPMPKLSGYQVEYTVIGEHVYA
jgi:hypothetical protein